MAENMPHSKPKFLVAGELPQEVEDYLFKTARLHGAICARISGMDTWLQMVGNFHFGAVFLGAGSSMVEVRRAVEKGKALAPETPIVVVGAHPHGVGDFGLLLGDVEKELPGVIRRLLTKSAASEA
ncbi:MAG: hypothetical protein JW909_13290 [Planctomycetes bacterium]|nr:hypothetical protein [Planctomycetota bacterium]